MSTRSAVTVFYSPAALEGFANERGLDPDATRTALAAWAESRDSLRPVSMDGPHDRGTDDTPTDRLEVIDGRYLVLGMLGEGGMGSVCRVNDLTLQRTLAMKITHTALSEASSALARFVGEAQATAQLQHPSIVPIHDFGTLGDGRAWFTMKEVRGRTLGQAIDDLHRERSAETPLGSVRGFRRLISQFTHVCRAVAYAHERGVVHRDLKPDNVMIGAHGEVLVLDWGLAKVLGRATPAAAEAAVQVSSPLATRAGTVAGTPAYMAPEQARGEIDAVGPQADLYALGAILYHLLSGRPPFEGSAAEVLLKVRTGPPPALGKEDSEETFGFDLDLDLDAAAQPPGLPQELVELCEGMMSRVASQRTPPPGRVAEALEAWLDGESRRARALEVVVRAAAHQKEAMALAARAEVLREASAVALQGVEPWEPEARKVPGWNAAAEAEEALVDAGLKELEAEETLKLALQLAPDLVEAHAELASLLLERHIKLERARAHVLETSKVQALLAAHAAALPEHDAIRIQVAAHLRGDGRLTLHTEPQGATVWLVPFVEHHRRLIEGTPVRLGKTPLRGKTVPMGSYVCRIEHPDCDPVRYPVKLGRGEHWDGVMPGEARPTPIWLPPAGFLGRDEVYVPAGWFEVGGDPRWADDPAGRLWSDGFVMHRFPVTLGQYLAFLNDRVASGHEDEALEHAPREAFQDSHQSPLLVRFHEGRFSLFENEDPQRAWRLDDPAIQVSWEGAAAWLRWRAERTRRPWRLPLEYEWEKAARGTDGRLLPFGPHFDPSWACVFASHRDAPRTASVDSFAVDSSPYGIRGMTGNVQDWCLDPFLRPEILPVSGRVSQTDAVEEAVELRCVRGGSWLARPEYARPAHRNRADASVRLNHIGFRGVFSCPTGAD